MKPIDRWLQRWRVAKATPWVRPGDRLLDIGCFDQTLIGRVRARVRSAVGIDPDADPCEENEGRIRLVRGRFPEDLPHEAGSFDCATALAVLEHVERPEIFAGELYRMLTPGGRVVLTVPHPFVDRILDVLIAMRLIDGMETEAHHGFDVERTVPIFEKAGFRLLTRRRFQLGLNQLFVFEKPAEC